MPEKKKGDAPPRSSVLQELKAIETVAKALAPLTPDARQRVLEWAKQRFDFHEPAGEWDD